MDKTGFLKELKQYLAVLNEGEQKDIMDEYAQHIDMKMERGMSESEAIKEFGDIEELATEILEAYHVNPQFGAKKHTKFTSIKEEIPVGDLAKKSRHFWSKGVEYLKKMGAGVAGGLSRVWHMVRKPFHRMKEAWVNWRNSEHKQPEWHFRRRVDGQDTDGTRGIRRRKMFGEIPGMAVSGIRSLLMMAVGLALWCVRWAWNAFMLFLSLIAGGMTLMCLFGLGTLMVLLMQGYPLAGLTIGCLGLVLCGGSLTVTVFCLCRFRAGRRGANHTEARGMIKDEQLKGEQKFAELDVQEVTEHV